MELLEKRRIGMVLRGCTTTASHHNALRGPLVDSRWRLFQNQPQVMRDGRADAAARRMGGQSRRVGTRGGQW
ncbi:hypothetical protein [Cupriavidus sp. L7L]|uniref:hypothetical protein n=1 Tax=Cupriavidus sp. L7L TaxID=2546443 RepID=UPI001054A228|nr:hypothetical protein [Cupriavidus sp. L7L]TDF65483.1 hypothetical protein E1J61_13015 [Cupriavidus sp. L7L]